MPDTVGIEAQQFYPESTHSSSTEASFRGLLSDHDCHHGFTVMVRDIRHFDRPSRLMMEQARQLLPGLPGSPSRTVLGLGQHELAGGRS